MVITNYSESYLLNIPSDDLALPQKLSSLQKMKDAAEKNGESPFCSFSDTDMLMWYLYDSKNLDVSKDRMTRTTIEYRRELEQFLHNLLTYHEEMDIHFEQIIKGSLFKSLFPQDMRKYQSWLATKSPYVIKHGNYSPATLSRKTTILKSFFSFLYKENYIEQRLADGFKISSVQKDDRPNRDLGPKDVLALLHAFKEQQHIVMFTIVHVLTTTGIRNEEFCKLRVKDLCRDSILGGYYLKIDGKGNKKRNVPVIEKVVETIRMFRKARGLVPIEVADKDSPLFTTNRGKAFSVTYLSRYVKEEIKALPEGILSEEVTITPHVFRHAFAIISNMHGINLNDISRSLGHEDQKTTMIYLEKIFEKERHAIHRWKPEIFGEFI